MRIEAADLSVYHVPIREPWGDTTHAITHIDLLLLDLHTDRGLVGTGFTYSVGVGLKAVEALLRWDVVPKLIGLARQPARHLAAPVAGPARHGRGRHLDLEVPVAAP